MTTLRAPLLLPPPSGPDRLFRVGPLRVENGPGSDGAGGHTVVAATMRSGPWCHGPDGRPGVGSLCVLLDAVLGQATIVGRPDGHWPVTTEMTVDLCGPIPDEGGDITVRAWVVEAGDRSVLARGDVLGPRGELIGVGTEWGRFLPEVPDLDYAVDPDAHVDPPDGDAAAVLGAVFPGHAAPPGGVAEERPTLVLPGSSALANERDTMHGGILAAVSELAAVAVLPGTPERPLVTGSLHVSYLRPAGLDAPTTVGTDTVHAGRSFGVVRTDVRNTAGKLAAAATVTRRALD
ncbi:MAG: PaaI family thioesterase [Pseudonocardia sp.]|nr:PaaI family thioesterase [Pseudonocardia sp.]